MLWTTLNRRQFLERSASSTAAAILGNESYRSALAQTAVERLRVTIVVDKGDVRPASGTAYYLESWRAGQPYRILFNFGSSEVRLRHNYNALGINPNLADALVLASYEQNNFGGLPAVMRAFRGRNPAPRIPFYVPPGRSL